MLIVQSDAFNRSRIGTVIALVLTSSLRLLDAPGNVLVLARESGLSRDSVANVSQIVSLDRGVLTDRVGRLPAKKLHLVMAGLDVVLGR